MKVEKILMELAKKGTVKFHEKGVYYIISRVTNIKDIAIPDDFGIIAMTNTFILYTATLSSLKNKNNRERIKEEFKDTLEYNLINDLKKDIQEIGIQKIIDHFKRVKKAEVAIRYEMLTGNRIELKGKTNVFKATIEKDNLTFYIDEPFNARGWNVEPIQISYEELKKKLIGSPFAYQIGGNLNDAGSLLLRLIEYLFETSKFHLATDPFSETMNVFSNLQDKKVAKKDRKSVKLDTLDTQVIINSQKIRVDEIPIFLNSLHPRLGDVYNAVLDICFKSGYTKNGSKTLEISAKKIAEMLYKKTTKRNVRVVAEVLNHLRNIDIRIPRSKLPNKIQEVISSKFKPKSTQYFIIKPFQFILSSSEDPIDSPTTRIHRAIVIVNPILWFLYYELRMHISAPTKILQLDPSKTPERWAKNISIELYNHIRRNHKNTEITVSFENILKRTSIYEEVEKMRKFKHQQRLMEYFDKSLKLVTEILNKDGIQMAIQPLPYNIEDYLQAKIILKTE
ncbi:MAG: hypothetical protein J7L34_03265 [Thermotogaceae bacterium]|nr:hypothetical protein [Thermotogaceae bacterium]